MPMAADKRITRSRTKRDKPTITKKGLERLVSINNGASPLNTIKRSGSEEPEFAPSPATSTLTSRPKDVTNVKPAIQKPTFDFAALRAQSSLLSSLPSFLDQMKAANEELEAEKRAGTIKNRRLEIEDSSSDEESSSDEDEEVVEGAEKKAKEKKEKKERGQYIEMNLGLGVLEEKNSDDETSSSGSSDESDEDEDMGVMDKLQGTEREEIDARKKAKIEVVKET